MQFFWKLFKALNSAQNPWQVTVAITLGMLAGLTPMSGVQSVAIIFIALIINIHFGLFLVASALFAGVGYLFDPLFESLGYYLLASEGLQGFWSSCYDSGVMRLTYFNNTLVLGSTLFALAMALPLQLLLGWLINRYRDALTTLLSRYPKLGFMGVLSASKKLDRAFRIVGLGVFAGLGGLIAVFLLLFLDPMLKWGIENGASSALNRDVRIASLDTDVGAGAITINRLEVAGEQAGVDALSIEKTAIDIDLNALLFQQTHVESIVMEGMGFDTPATLKKAEATSEAAKPAEKAKEGSAAGSMLSGIDMSVPKPRTLLDQAGLTSQKRVEEAEKEIRALREKWEKIYREELSKESIEPLKTQFNALKEQAKTKDPAKLLALKGDIEKFTDDVKAYKQRLQTIRDDFKKDKARITALAVEVKEAGAKDYAKLKSTYTLDGSGALNVIGTLFGEKVQGYIAMARKYYAMAEPYLSGKTDETVESPTPPRGEGRWISFPSSLPQPDLLIKSTLISGLLKSQHFDAQISNITDDQKKLGKAMTFGLNSDGEKIQGLKVKGEDNRLGEQVRDVVQFEAKNYPLKQADIGGLLLEQSDMAFKGSVTLTGLAGIKGQTSAQFNDARMDLPGQGALVQSILEGIDAFGVTIDIDGNLEKPALSVRSDLDKKLSSALKQTMQKELAKYQDELKVLMDEQLNEKLAGLGQQAGGIPDIEGASGTLTSELGALDTSSLLKKEGGLKSFLPF